MNDAPSLLESGPSAPLKGLEAVQAVMGLNQLLEDSYKDFLTHYSKSTRRGNTPILFKDQDHTQPTELRLTEAMHSVLRGMVGALGATLNTEALPEEITAILGQLRTETEIYAYYGNVLREMHKKKIGKPVLKEGDADVNVTAFKEGCHYRDFKTMVSQLRSVGSDHIDPETGNVISGDPEIMPQLKICQEEIQTQVESTKKLLEQLETAFSGVKEFYLKGQDHPVMNRTAGNYDHKAEDKVASTVSWLYFAAAASEMLLDDTRRPSTYNYAVNDCVGAAQDVLKRFGPYLLASPELHQEVLFQPFERAVEKMQNKVVTIAAKEELSHQPLAASLCRLLNITETNYQEIMQRACHEKGETAAMREKKAVGGCPFGHGPK